ncbi:hypothetical protein EYF80_011111 [Liparis tanakae]|uniref:Uncharacterized protein n=1 Tax=Liparis tanakae TaxID=230148 RepID=A0A4Z2ILR9_9TELE|nr:hypothetical protein EYF80_011111 [Liparis tanakae]
MDVLPSFCWEEEVLPEISERSRSLSFLVLPGVSAAGGCSAPAFFSASLRLSADTEAGSLELAVPPLLFFPGSVA